MKGVVGSKNGFEMSAGSEKTMGRESVEKRAEGLPECRSNPPLSLKCIRVIRIVIRVNVILCRIIIVIRV